MMKKNNNTLEKISIGTLKTYKNLSVFPIIGENIKQNRLERLIDLQSKITLNSNKDKIGSIQYVLIEKESKKSDKYWSGRTDGNTWTVIKKNQEKINDIVPVKIIDARGVTLFGNCLTKEELLYENN